MRTCVTLRVRPSTADDLDLLARRHRPVLAHRPPELAVDLHLPLGRRARLAVTPSRPTMPLAPVDRAAGRARACPCRRPRQKTSAGGRAHRGDDHVPGDAEPVVSGASKSMSEPSSMATTPPTASTPWLTTLISAISSTTPNRSRSRPAQLIGQALEGEEGQDQADAADDAGQDRARVGQLEEDAEHADHHQEVGDVRDRRSGRGTGRGSAPRSTLTGASLVASVTGPFGRLHGRGRRSSRAGRARCRRPGPRP